MGHIGTKPINTKRMLLRRFKVSDAEAMFTGWANDSEVTRWMRWKPHESPAETRQLLQEWAQRYRDSDFYTWAMADCQSGELIGSIGIWANTEPQEEKNMNPATVLPAGSGTTDIPPRRWRRFWNTMSGASGMRTSFAATQSRTLPVGG